MKIISVNAGFFLINVNLCLIDIQLWVAFGTGNHYKLFTINTICHKFGEAKCRSMPFFHSLTGSDTTSQFHGKGKKSCWEAWNLCPEVTQAFLSPQALPFQHIDFDSITFTQIETFVCILYDKKVNLSSVNKLRQNLFSKKACTMETIPPTKVRVLFLTILKYYSYSISLIWF